MGALVSRGELHKNEAQSQVFCDACVGTNPPVRLKLSSCSVSVSMAPRANLKGFLRLSLVTCPVALFPATSKSEKISFNPDQPEYRPTHQVHEGGR